MNVCKQTGPQRLRSIIHMYAMRTYFCFVTLSQLTGMFTICSSALSDSRSPEEKTNIVDEFFKRYENKVAKRPEDHGMDYVHAYIVIEKK